MANSSVKRLLLIVTGSHLRAEEVDRPLAYYLRNEIERYLETLDDAGGLQVRVVSDLRWLHDEVFQEMPTISLGGHGVNLLAHRWLEELPFSMDVNNQYFVQMDPDLTEPKVSIWGKDNPTTQLAVLAFVNRFLPRFIECCFLETSDPVDLEDFD
ncbi:hypothetical protein [Tautonia rosea]|uniref:hypothetical protein n=1 Tax=Tautonia rosea TaxID=2728037 RepID=UPI0014759969|nr:hypothetical protein [Tautonia rosea]